MEDCIKMFFHKTPPSNQFLCRAYLCQAQLNAPTSSKNPVSNSFITNNDRAVTKIGTCHVHVLCTPRNVGGYFNSCVLGKKSGITLMIAGGNPWTIQTVLNKISVHFHDLDCFKQDMQFSMNFSLF